MAWNCPVCGFSEKETQAPANCPVCGAPGTQFTASASVGSGAPAQSGKEAAQTVDKDTVSKPTDGQWKCPVCGYVRSGDRPEEPCPVCGAAAERFVSLDGSPAAPEKVEAAATREMPSRADRQERKWRCTVCGYIHTGPEPPEKCPVCGSDRSVFVEIAAEKAPKAPQPAGRPTRADTPVSEKTAQPPSSVWMQRFEMIRQKMVELHAHPISVHIPNGLLPIAVLFLLLSMVFDSQSLSKASFYNLIVVALAMPGVLFSGYNDWQKRFGGHMTSVFMIKMTCGGIIAAGSFLLVLWRLVSPAVASAGSSGRWAYLFVHLVLLAAAMMAGYQGGKLVIFPDASGGE